MQKIILSSFGIFCLGMYPFLFRSREMLSSDSTVCQQLSIRAHLSFHIMSWTQTGSNLLPNSYHLFTSALPHLSTMTERAGPVLVGVQPAYWSEPFEWWGRLLSLAILLTFTLQSQLFKAARMHERCLPGPAVKSGSWNLKAQAAPFSALDCDGTSLAPVWDSIGLTTPVTFSSVFGRCEALSVSQKVFFLKNKLVKMQNHHFHFLLVGK